MKPEIHNRKKTGKVTSMWKLNNKHWAKGKKKSQENLEKYLEMVGNKNKT